MTLTQLKYVLAIAKAGTINAAAKQLFISQPTLSSAVKELEAELNRLPFLGHKKLGGFLCVWIVG